MITNRSFGYHQKPAAWKNLSQTPPPAYTGITHTLEQAIAQAAEWSAKPVNVARNETVYVCKVTTGNYAYAVQFQPEGEVIRAYRNGSEVAAF